MTAPEARYDAVAHFYATGWTDDIDEPASAALLELLGPVDGSRLLDVACGHGRISRALARRGATVLGVDLSAGLLARAVEHAEHEPLPITYVQGDASSVAWLGSAAGTFDAAVCSFGLSDVDNLDGCLAMVAQALKPGGRFVCSILHPCFAGGGAASGSWPSTGSYHDEGWWAADGAASTLRQKVGGNHRTLATYLNTLHRYGLVVDHVDEPMAPLAWREANPLAAGYPLYLVLRCTLD